MKAAYFTALGEAARATGKDAVRFAVQRVQIRGKAGQVIATVPESKIVETLIEEAMRLAEEEGLDAAGTPEVTVG